jgi:hypothetical protein
MDFLLIWYNFNSFSELPVELPFFVLPFPDDPNTISGISGHFHHYRHTIRGVL